MNPPTCTVHLLSASTLMSLPTTASPSAVKATVPAADSVTALPIIVVAAPPAFVPS
jgi:hypothetical protein